MNLHQSRDGIRELRATLADGERNLTHRGRNHRSRHHQLGDNDPLLSVCGRVFGVDDQSQKVSVQSVDLRNSRTECIGAVGIQQHWYFRHHGPPRNVRRYIYARHIFPVKGNLHAQCLLKRAQPQSSFASRASKRRTTSPTSSNSFSFPASSRAGSVSRGDARPGVSAFRAGATPFTYRSSKYRYAAKPMANPITASGRIIPTSVFSMPCNLFVHGNVAIQLGTGTL